MRVRVRVRLFLIYTNTTLATEMPHSRVDGTARDALWCERADGPGKQAKELEGAALEPAIRV